MFCVLGRKESSPLPDDFLWYSVLIFGSLYGNLQGMSYPVRFHKKSKRKSDVFYLEEIDLISDFL